MELNFTTLNELSLIHGDSFYLLDSKCFSNNYDEFLGCFTDIYPKTTIGYSYKTNYIPKLCKIIDSKGGYAEVVSEMEYDLALQLDVKPEKIIVNGPYKPKKALCKFLLNKSIVNLDSYMEFELLKEIAIENPNEKFSIGLRCNFDIGNSFISRFGFDVLDPKFSSLIRFLHQSKNISLIGLHCHFPDRNLDSYKIRVEVILKLVDDIFEVTPEYIDIGGGYFGKMDESLKEQFDIIYEYNEYAYEIATRFKEHFSALNDDEKPMLLLEPGSAIVADAVRFVTKVIEIKNIRGKDIAMTAGSKFNMGLLSSSINMPMDVMSRVIGGTSFSSIDVSGYTCIESDYLYKGYSGVINIGDYLMFSNVGSYSIVFKPPFILPNVPILDISHSKTAQQVSMVKRQETVSDIFSTFIMEGHI